MMPNNCRWTEPKRPALLLQAPTNIHVITRHSELRIEAADSLQRRHAKSHVAPGNMFRLPVCQQDMDRPARRVRDAICDEAITRRRNIRTANSRKVVAR